MNEDVVKALSWIPNNHLPRPFIDVRQTIGAIEGIVKSGNFDARPALNGGTLVCGGGRLISFLCGSIVGDSWESTIFPEASVGDYGFIVKEIGAKKSENQSIMSKGQFFTAFYTYFFTVSKGGVFYHNNVRLSLEYLNRGKFFPAFELMTDRAKEAVIQAEDRHNHRAAAYGVAGLMTFLNCRNIEIVDKPTSVSTRTFNPHKGIRYKEIVVTPTTKYNKNKSETTSANVIPLHLCRGHIKTYTEEKPLFGRITGQYYWHPHMRGNKENGEVVKDYKLVN